MSELDSETGNSCLGNFAQYPKIMEGKFFQYLNNLSKGISALKNKTQIPTSQNKYRSETETMSFNSRTSRKSNCQKKLLRISSRQNQRVEQNFRILSAERSQNGSIKGQVHLQYSDGSRYIGTFQKGQRIKGKMIYKSGLQLFGTFKNNEEDGISSIVLIDGTIIEIQWKQGTPQNRGKITYTNGDVYVGSIENFKKHGFGELKIMKRNRKYVGQFKDGRINGIGVLYENGKIVEEGRWVNGSLQTEKMNKNRRISLQSNIQIDEKTDA